MRSRVWAVLGLLNVELWGAPVRAEPTPRVAVTIVAEPAMRASLEAAVTKQRELPVSLRVVPLPNQAGERGSAAAEAALAEVLQAARTHYIEADFETCLSKLPESAQLIDLLAAGDRVTPARVLLWRVACEVGRGGSAEAARAAAEFASLSLLVPAEVSAVAPDAERLLTDALHAAQAAPRVQVQIDSKPSGREVWLDGRAIGCVTPCSDHVVAGDHVVSLRGDGTRPLARWLRTSDGAQALMLTPELASPELARAQWSARYRTGELDGAASLQLLSQALPARKLVLITVDPVAHGNLELRGAYVEDGGVAARAGAGPIAQPELGDEGVRLIQELLVRGHTLAAPRPLWKSGWFWGAIGVVAAGTATATALLLRKPSERTEVRFQ